MNKNCPDGTAILMSNLARIHENIKFADTKAGAVSVINTALLAAVFSFVIDKGQKIAIGNIITEFPLLLAFISMLILALGIASGISVIWPRADNISKDRGPGLIDPVRVTQYENNDYIEILGDVKSDLIYEQMHELTWDMSRIDRIKYSRLNATLWLSVFAWVVTVVSIMLVAVKI